MFLNQTQVQQLIQKLGREIKEEDQMSTLKLRNIVVAAFVAGGGLFVSEKTWTSSPSSSLVTQAEARIGRPGTALSVAGVARRHYRRAAVAGAVVGGALAAGYGYGTGYPYYGYTSYSSPYYDSSYGYGYGYGYPSYGTYGYSSYGYPYSYASYGWRRWWW
jgi:hypothetical protein